MSCEPREADTVPVTRNVLCRTLKIRSGETLRSSQSLYPVGRAASSSLAPNAVPSASDPNTVGTTHEKEIENMRDATRAVARTGDRGSTFVRFSLYGIVAAFAFRSLRDTVSCGLSGFPI